MSVMHSVYASTQKFVKKLWNLIKVVKYVDLNPLKFEEIFSKIDMPPYFLFLLSTQIFTLYYYFTVNFKMYLQLSRPKSFNVIYNIFIKNTAHSFLQSLDKSSWKQIPYFK